MLSLNGRQVAQGGHHAVRWLARIGYGARGLVYLAVAVIAVHAALEFEQAADVRGALREINQHPGGRIVLFALALGLMAYGFWRAIQSVLDVDRHGWSVRALAVRIGLLVSAAVHASLAVGCVRIAMRLGEGHGKPIQQAVSTTLEWPWGRPLVVLGGLIIAGVGLAHWHKAATGGFRCWFDASPAAMRWIGLISRFGLAARGLLFIGVAGFVIYSAFTLDASDARGVEGVLFWVQERVYGRLLLGVLGMGVFAFGCYSLIEAWVRQVGLGYVVQPER